MPVKITKVAGGWRVSTPNMVHAKHTSLHNAKAQERIINAHEHTGWKPTHKKKHSK